MCSSVCSVEQKQSYPHTVLLSVPEEFTVSCTAAASFRRVVDGQQGLGNGSLLWLAEVQTWIFSPGRRP